MKSLALLGLSALLARGVGGSAGACKGEACGAWAPRDAGEEEASLLALHGVQQQRHWDGHTTDVPPTPTQTPWDGHTTEGQPTQDPLMPQIDQMATCLNETMKTDSETESPDQVILRSCANCRVGDPDELWTLHNHLEADQLNPYMVVFPKNRQQVAQTVLCAVRAGFPVVSQSGRHAYIGYCKTGCVLVNIYRMKEVDISVGKEFATLEAGLNLGQAYTWLADKGFTIPGGTCPTVGLAGITLGGGKGILARQHGLLIDKLAGVDAILPNGTFIQANAQNYSDLFWLARGGGGNTFPGVVTAFHFNLVRTPDVVTEYSGQWALADYNHGPRLSIKKGEEVFNFWQENFLVHPDRRVYCRLEMSPYPQSVSYGGVKYETQPFISLNFKFLGMNQKEAQQYLEEMWRVLGKPQGPDTMKYMKEHDEKGSGDGGVWSSRTYIQSLAIGGGIGSGQPGCARFNLSDPASINWRVAREEMLNAEPPFCSWDGAFDTNVKYRSLVSRRLSPEAVHKFLTTVVMAPAFQPDPSQTWQFYLQIDPSNGAAGEVPPEATAYPWRGMDEMTLQVIAKWSKYDQDRFALAEGTPNANPTLEGFNYLLVAVMQPYMGTRSYYNYADDDMPGGAIPLFSYFGANAQRILAIRQKYRALGHDGSVGWELEPRRAGFKGSMTGLPSVPEQGNDLYPTV